MSLEKDIRLKDTAFNTASEDMEALKIRTEALKEKLESMYKDLTGALQTPAGEQIQITAKKTLLQPIEDLSLVIQQNSEALAKIIETGHYKDVFVEFEELNRDIK
jgi:predicted  nucleic acid-binding Zn-ribbon protein